MTSPQGASIAPCSPLRVGLGPIFGVSCHGFAPSPGVFPLLVLYTNPYGARYDTLPPVPGFWIRPYATRVGSTPGVQVWRSSAVNLWPAVLFIGPLLTSPF